MSPPNLYLPRASPGRTAPLLITLVVSYQLVHRIRSLARHGNSPAGPRRGLAARSESLVCRAPIDFRYRIVNARAPATKIIPRPTAVVRLTWFVRRLNVDEDNITMVYGWDLLTPCHSFSFFFSDARDEQKTCFERYRLFCCGFFLLCVFLTSLTL